MRRRARRHPRIGRIFSSDNIDRYGEKTYYNEEYREHNTFKTVIIAVAILIALGAAFVIIRFAVFGNNNTQEATKTIPATPTQAPVQTPRSDVQISTDTEISDPEPSATPVPGEYTTIKYGAESDDVKKLQERLTELGYLHITETTTYFGAVTRTAVKAFQRQHSLKQTGNANSKTLELLYSDNAKEYELKDGDDGEDVQKLQEILVKLRYIDSSAATGHYGSTTRHAIRDFQDRNDLEKTGVADRKTIDLLYELNNKR